MDQAEIEKLIGELEIAVDRLRSLYEQYFMGIEKLEPTVPRKDVDRRIYILRKVQVRNTALRFRFQMLLQRYNTYQSHWQRVCRDIENGTYKRHVIRAQQRFGTKRASLAPPPANAQAGPASKADELAELDREFAPAATLDDDDVLLDDDSSELPAPERAAEAGVRATVARPAGQTPSSLPPRAPPPARASLPGAPPSAPASVRGPPSGPVRPLPAASVPAAVSVRAVRAPVAAAPAKTAITAAGPAPPRSPELPDERVRQLYGQFVEAKRRQNESTAAITYEAVAKSLRESSAKLRGKHGKAVDFEVAIKDGRAIIRPVIK
jgi:hypothetical protein